MSRRSFVKALAPRAVDLLDECADIFAWGYNSREGLGVEGLRAALTSKFLDGLASRLNADPVPFLPFCEEKLISETSCRSMPRQDTTDSSRVLLDWPVLKR